MKRLWNRLHDRLRRDRLADELGRELRFHQSMLERDYRAEGMIPAEAASAARREIGNRTSIQEESRAVWTFTMFEHPLQDVRVGVRALRRAPAFTIVAVLTLALGIGAVAAIFTVVNGVLLRPLPFGNPDRLVAAWHDMPPLNIVHGDQTVGSYFTYLRLARTIEGIGAYQEGAANVAEPGSKDDPQHPAAAWISATLLPVLQVPPLRGRYFTADEDRPDGPGAAIISETMWRRQFNAAPDVVGRTIEVDGATTHIVGVMPGRFRFPSASTQLWLPLQLDPTGKGAAGFNYNAVARLKPGVTVTEAGRDFTAVLPRIVELFPSFAPGVSMKMMLDQARPTPVLVPLRQDVTGRIARILWIVAAAAGLVLLVACANVINLLLVRVDARHREIAVREALGAGRGRLVMHCFAEAATLSGIGAAIGWVLAWLGVRMLVLSSPSEIPRLAELKVDVATLGFTVAIALLVAVVCTAIPALRIGRTDLSNGLREGGRGGTAGRRRHRVRAALVATQMALALVVLAGSGLLIRTFGELRSVKPGFEPDHVATFWLSLPQGHVPSDSAVVRFYSALTERVSHLPGVQSVGLTSRLPLGARGLNQNPIYPENDPSYQTRVPPLQIFTTVDSGYFGAMGIRIIAGHSFDGLVRQRGDETIISQRTAQMFYHDSSGRAAIGQRFRHGPGGAQYSIIGVAGNARDTSLAAPPTQVVYFPEVVSIDHQMMRNMALTVRTTGDPMAITGAVRAAVRGLDPTLPIFDVRSMSSVFNASMATLTFVMLILGGAATVTLILGAVGLYGVMAYVVTLRTRELGLRIALGAQPLAVAALLTRQGLALTACGLAGGLGLFALVAHFLRAFLVGVAPGDPLILGAASLVLVVIAAGASWIPARRASRVDPVLAMRAV